MIWLAATTGQTWLAFALDMPDADSIDPTWSLMVMLVVLAIGIALAIGALLFPPDGEPRVDRDDPYANPFGDVVICPPNMRAAPRPLESAPGAALRPADAGAGRTSSISPGPAGVRVACAAPGEAPARSWEDPRRG